MIKNKVGAAALVVVLPLTVVAGTVVAADAASASASKITAAASDKTPASGQKFNVSGTFKVENAAAADHVVRVQAKQNGSWKNLKGAHDDTNKSGAYKLNVILNSTGALKLRVVGIGQGSEQDAYKNFTVTVH